MLNYMHPIIDVAKKEAAVQILLAYSNSTSIVNNSHNILAVSIAQLCMTSKKKTKQKNNNKKHQQAPLTSKTGM